MAPRKPAALDRSQVYDVAGGDDAVIDLQEPVGRQAARDAFDGFIRELDAHPPPDRSGVIDDRVEHAVQRIETFVVRAKPGNEQLAAIDFHRGRNTGQLRRKPVATEVATHPDHNGTVPVRLGKYPGELPITDHHVVGPFDACAGSGERVDQGERGGERHQMTAFRRKMRTEQH